MVELRNLQVRYETKNMVVQAVRDASLTINRGEVFGIVGTSGAGKSSLLRAVNLLERPYAGSVIFEGQDISFLKGKELRQVRHKMGMVFQHFNLLSTETIFNNVAFPLKIAKKSKKEIEVRVKELLDLVGLSDKAQVYPSQLSGGQKQRVGIARALANAPSLLLCDEPTSALDLDTSASILELLKEINQKLKVTILIISHEMAVIKSICDRVAVMSDGDIVEMGSVYDIFARPQHDFTKALVDKTINLELPQRIAESFSGTILRLLFLGSSAEQSVISKAIKTYGADINILHGKIEYLSGSPVGILVVGINPMTEEIMNYLKANTARLEVLHG